MKLKKKSPVLFLCLILAACHVPNGEDNGNPLLPADVIYGREFLGEWIRMDTGDIWYITSTSISVNNKPSSRQVSMEKESARVIVVTEDARKYGLYASRTASGSFSGRIVGDAYMANRSAADVARSFGNMGGMDAVIRNIKDKTQEVTAKSDEQGEIMVESVIPGDSYEITVDDQTTVVTPHIDGEDIGTVTVTRGKNFKTTLRPKDPNMDMTRLYANRPSGTAVYTYEFYLDIENTGTETWNAATYLLGFSYDLNFTGNRMGILGTTLPGMKYSLPITLSCDPVTAPFVMRQATMRITDPSVPDKEWNDSVSVKFNRAPVRFNISSSRAVQGVIITPAARAYRFITERSGEVYSASLAMPWTNEDYLVVFSGAEAGTEAVYSLGINVEPPSDFRFFIDTWIYEPNNTENQAHRLDMHTAIMQGWVMAYLSVNDFDYYRVNIGPYIEYVE